MRCHCMEKVEQLPRNYTKTSIKKIPDLQIFGYFCKNCSKHFGFFAKGIVPGCPITPNPWNLTDEEEALDRESYVAKIQQSNNLQRAAFRKYLDKLWDEHQIEAEAMDHHYLGILKWEDMEEDWHQWNHKITGRKIPIFSGHITLKEVNEVINPGKVIGERLNKSGNYMMDEGELIYPFRVFSNGKYQFSGQN